MKSKFKAGEKVLYKEKEFTIYNVKKNFSTQKLSYRFVENKQVVEENDPGLVKIPQGQGLEKEKDSIHLAIGKQRKELLLPFKVALKELHPNANLDTMQEKDYIELGYMSLSDFDLLLSTGQDNTFKNKVLSLGESRKKSLEDILPGSTEDHTEKETFDLGSLSDDLFKELCEGLEAKREKELNDTEEKEETPVVKESKKDKKAKMKRKK